MAILLDNIACLQEKRNIQLVMKEGRLYADRRSGKSRNVVNVKPGELEDGRLFVTDHPVPVSGAAGTARPRRERKRRVPVPVAGHQIRGQGAQRHEPAVGADPGRERAVGLPATRIDAGPEGGPRREVPDEHVGEPVRVLGDQVGGERPERHRSTVTGYRGSEACPFESPPPTSALARTVVPTTRSRTNTSWAPFPSTATRSEASDENAT